MSLSAFQAPPPVDCSRVNDLVTRSMVNRSLEQLIRSRGRLVGEHMAILMHVEALEDGDVVSVIERSRDLRWLNGQPRDGTATLKPIGGASHDATRDLSWRP